MSDGLVSVCHAEYSERIGFSDPTGRFAPYRLSDSCTRCRPLSEAACSTTACNVGGPVASSSEVLPYVHHTTDLRCDSWRPSHRLLHANQPQWARSLVH